MEIRPEIERATLFPETDWADPAPGRPTKRVHVAGVAVRLPASLPVGLVMPERVDDVGGTVAAVRAFLHEEGRPQAFWMVPEAASPPDLAAQLCALGLRPADRAPMEPRAAAMVALRPPPPGPPEIIARPAETFDDYLASQQVVADAFGTDDELRRAFERRATVIWESREGSSELPFVAVLDGDVIAFGGTIRGKTTVFLSGGGTRPDRRGHGAYRALVRARWDYAVSLGTPVLTVGAGPMSQPILERLGFEIVGWIDCLLDDR